MRPEPSGPPDWAMPGCPPSEDGDEGEGEGEEADLGASLASDARLRIRLTTDEKTVDVPFKLENILLP